jgi:hypothetical protein
MCRKNIFIGSKIYELARHKNLNNFSAKIAHKGFICFKVNDVFEKFVSLNIKDISTF